MRVSASKYNQLMKSLNKLLQDHSLHNIQAFAALIQAKQIEQDMLNKLDSNLTKASRQVDSLKASFQQIQEGSVVFIERLSGKLQRQLDQLQALISQSFKCGCGYLTTCDRKMREHMLQNQEKSTCIGQSSHYFTAMHNLLQVPTQLSTLGKETLVKQRHRKQIGRPQSVTTAKKIATHRSYHNQNKQSRSVTLPNKFNLDKECGKSIKNETLQWFCGECQKYFDNFKRYTHHFQTHDYVITRSCSHVIFRDKKSGSVGIKIVADSQALGRTYTCPCKERECFTHPEFIEHVLKWHKGITPRC